MPNIGTSPFNKNMKIKLFRFEVTVLEIDGEKFIMDIPVRAVDWKQGLKDLWQNQIDKEIDLSTVASMKVTNLSDMLKV